MTTTLDQLVAKSMQLTGAVVLFVGHGRFCGPGSGVLLAHPTGKDMWELPTDEVATDSNLDVLVPFGDVLLARVDSQFVPAPSQHYDDYCWTNPEFAVCCTANHPNTTAVLKQFLAERGDVTSTSGESSMEPRSVFVEIQSRAQRALGDSAAPGPMQGESSHDYECRLVKAHLPHSKQFSGTDIDKVRDPVARAMVAASAYADSAAYVAPGVLRPRKIRDASGREMTAYDGDDGACWDQFNPPIRRVARFLTGSR